MLKQWDNLAHVFDSAIHATKFVPVTTHPGPAHTSVWRIAVLYTDMYNKGKQVIFPMSPTDDSWICIHNSYL